MKTDNAYPPDPWINMTPEDIAELKLIDSKVRLEHSAAKMRESIKWTRKPPPSSTTDDE